MIIVLATLETISIQQASSSSSDEHSDEANDFSSDENDASLDNNEKFDKVHTTNVP